MAYAAPVARCAAEPAVPPGARGLLMGASEAFRKQQRDHEEHHQRDGQHQADQVLGVHSRSTPRATTANTAKTAIVSNTNSRSATRSPSPSRLVTGCRRQAVRR